MIDLNLEEVMADRLVPKWIADIKDQETQGLLERQAHRDRELLAAKMIQADGPGFWASLLKELKITVCSLPEIGVQAEMVNLGGTHPEEHYRISAVLKSAFPSYSGIRLSYGGPRAKAIGCYPDEKASFSLRFVVYEEQLAVRDETTAHAPMSVEDAAEYIIQPLVKELKARRN
jgi:hypothetical protein